MSKREVWVIEAYGAPVVRDSGIVPCTTETRSDELAFDVSIIHSTPVTEIRAVRYTPAPEWREFDPERPPKAGRYQCEYAMRRNGSKRVGPCHFYSSLGDWLPEGGRSFIKGPIRYTDLPVPPDGE